MNLPRFFALAVFSSGVVCGQAPSINGCPSFPANNIWNAPVDTLPVAAHSADYIGSISSTGGLRYDITIPINIVPGSQPKVPLNITYPDEADPGPYPIPLTAQVEASSDRHVLVVDKDNCILYETFYSFLQADGSWNVDSSAKWSLLSNALRPADWTSADAAGLPIMPGLVRYDEILAGQINHALRFTAPSTQRLYVWPGRHYASSSSSPLLPPMGQRFRLKASVDISGYSANMQIILRAIKKYGLMLADNGLPWEMQIAVDPRWNTNELDTLGSIIGSNIEAVDVSSLMIDPNSGQAVSSNPPAVVVTPASPTMGLFQTQQFTATVTGSSLGVTWSMSPALGTLSATGFYTAPSSLTGSSTVTVTATLADGSASGKTLVTLVPATAALASVSVSPGAVVGGSNVNVTVTLTLPALGGGLPVTLTGSNSAFPTANVTVGAGLLSQTFSLPTSVVAALASVTITASYNGTSVTGSALSVLTPPGPGKASYVRTDTTTSGSWKGAYGADGYNVIGDSASYPSYVVVTPYGQSDYAWASSTSVGQALQKASSATDRIAACWFALASFTVDLTFGDTNTHQLSLYLLDWEGGRSENVDILDAGNNVLDTRTASSFANGEYLVWNVSGHVVVRITSNSSRNAVLSGIFFGTGTASADNPTPAVTSLAPASETAGGTSFTLTVNGTGFVSGSSVVRWNGAGQATTYVSATQLQAAISASDIATAGTAQVTVFNPTPGGGTSASFPFPINSVSTAAVGVSPASGNAFIQTMTFTFADARGYQDLDVVNVLIGNFLDGRNSCYLAYSRPLNVLYLINDAGTALLPGLVQFAGTASNSQCTVTGAGSSATGSGNTLMLVLNMSFSTAFVGNKVTYMAARDLEGGSSGWQALGTWGVPGATPFPSAGGVSPASGAGSSQTFTFTFTDPKGYQDLGIVNILINNFLDGRQSCYLAYSRPLNVLYLVNDGGTELLPGMEQFAGTASNSQCTVTGAGSSATGTGNTLTLVLNMSFSTAFNGNKVIYIAARDSIDANDSEWQPLGSWTVQ